MEKCTLSKKVGDGFKAIETMKAAEVDSLFSEYDRTVFAQPACADPDHYILVAEQFQRLNKFDLANLALAKALLAGPSGQMPYSRIAVVYAKMGFHETPSVLKYIGHIQQNQTTTVAVPNKGAVEYWQAVVCEDKLENCPEELQATQAAFIQNLKHQLLLSLHTNYFHQGVSPLDISTWLMDPMTIGAWKRDPKMVVEVLDYFIQKWEIVLENGDTGEMSNTLLILRDLLKLTAQFKWTEPVHHPDLKAFFKPYYYDKDGHTFTSVSQGVAFYFMFLLMLNSDQVPDEPLLAALKKISSDQSLAIRVEALAKSRKTAPVSAPGRKTK